MNTETRTTKCHSVEARSEGGRNTIVGYAATFDTPYPVDNVTEVIDRSAFTRTLQDTPDVFALVGHDPSRVLARTRNGTLSLSTDEKGLRCEILMNDTQESRDVFSLVQNGTLDSMSFGFKVRDQKFEYRDGGVHRRVRDVDLHEVSIVAFPANSEAKLTMRDKALAQRCIETRGSEIDLPTLPITVTDVRLDSNGNRTMYFEGTGGKKAKLQTNGTALHEFKSLDDVDAAKVEQYLIDDDKDLLKKLYPKWSDENRARTQPRDDETTETEVLLFAENYEPLYRQQIYPIITNLAKKMAKGIFDRQLAIKLFGYAVETAVKMYSKEHGAIALSPASRKVVAEQLLDSNMDTIESQAKEIQAAGGKRSSRAIQMPSPLAWLEVRADEGEPHGRLFVWDAHSERGTTTIYIDRYEADDWEADNRGYPKKVNGGGKTVVEWSSDQAESEEQAQEEWYDMFGKQGATDDSVLKYLRELGEANSNDVVVESGKRGFMRSSSRTLETRATVYVKFEGDREAWVENEDGDEIAGLMDGYDDPDEFYESQDIDGPNDAAGFARYLENLDFVKSGDVVVVGNKKHKVR